MCSVGRSREAFFFITQLPDANIQSQTWIPPLQGIDTKLGGEKKSWSTYVPQCRCSGMLDLRLAACRIKSPIVPLRGGAKMCRGLASSAVSSVLFFFWPCILCWNHKHASDRIPEADWERKGQGTPAVVSSPYRCFFCLFFSFFFFLFGPFSFLFLESNFCICWITHRLLIPHEWRQQLPTCRQRREGGWWDRDLSAP